MGIREDLRTLAVDIGPRGACTAAEGRAAAFIRTRFEERGLDASTQEFFTIDTYSYLYIIYIIIALACAALSYWFWFVYFVAPLAIANAVFFAMDLETFPVLSHLLPHKLSRNVIGEIPADGGKLGLVVVAHYDSARSAMSFNPRLVGNFRATFNLMIGCIFSVAALTTANLVIRLATGRTNIWVWVATLVASAYLVVPLFIMFHRERAMSYTNGANDNASGVATMLALMDKMSEPESVTPGVMFVATGAEEVGTAGMLEFLKVYRERIDGALIVNLDNLGTGHLCYIDCEGMLLGHRSDPVLLWLAGKVVEKKKLNVWRTGYRLLSTDATPALARGLPAMSVMAFDDDGLLPNWHWESDTIDRIDLANLETARAFLWNLARRMDLP